MKTKIVTTVLALAFIASACTDKVGEGKTRAAVATPSSEPAAVVAPTAQERTIAVDTTQSKVHALGAKITGKHDITFDTWSGTLRADDKSVTGVDITIQVSSLQSDSEKLTGHLKSADFFDVEKFPTATFVSATIVPKPEADGATHLVTGALTMHGVTKEVSFPAALKVGGEAVSATTEFVINRQDFGIKYPGKPDDLIQDDVVLTIALHGNSGKS